MINDGSISRRALLVVAFFVLVQGAARAWSDGGCEVDDEACSIEFRIMHEDRTAAKGQRVVGRLWSSRALGSEFLALDCASDEGGLIRVEGVPIRSSRLRRLEFTARKNRRRSAWGVAAIPAVLSPGVNRIGDVTLCEGEVAGHFGALSHEQLAGLLEAVLLYQHREPHCSEVLRESGRRKDEDWAGRLGEVAETCIPRPWKNRPPSHAMLSLLRAAEGRACPVEVEVVGPLQREVAPSLGLHVVVRIRNVDPECAFWIIEDPQVIGTRNGEPVVRRFVRSGGLGSGMRLPSTLQSGASVTCSVPVGDMLDLSQPGKYRLQLLLPDGADPGSEQMLARSEELQLLVRVRELHATADEVESWRRDILSFDVDGPTTLVASAWDEGLLFRGPSATPEERIFRAGVRTVPVLIEVAGSADVDARRRAAILAMLWNLTGLYDPSAYFNRTLGEYRILDHWPTVLGPEAVQLAGGHGEPDEHPQKAMLKWWMQAKPVFPLSVEN